MPNFRTTEQIMNIVADIAKGAFRVTTDLLYQWAGITTDATPKEIFLEATTNRFPMPLSSTLTFNITLAGMDRVTGDAITAHFEGSIKRTAAGTVSFISGSYTKSITKDDATWDTEIIADDVNKALVLQVTGDATNAVDWAAAGSLVTINI